jgi:hypothetical protein
MNSVRDRSLFISIEHAIHCKKRFAILPSPAGMALNKLSLGGNNLIIPVQGELLTSRLERGKSLIFFYSVGNTAKLTLLFLVIDKGGHANYFFYSANRKSANPRGSFRNQKSANF